MARKSKSFDSEIYQKVSISDLILFVIFSITEKREKCSFEKLVKECFSLFPKSFCFPKQPKWPDTRRIDRPLRTLRSKRLITGEPQTFFSPTKTGKKRAEETAKKFRQKKLTF